jgi:outer membrane protein assembly factor BamB
LTLFVEMFGSQDPYVELKIGDGSDWSFATEVLQDGGKKPKWKNLDFSGTLPEADVVDNAMKIRVKDGNDGTDKFIGKGVVSMVELINQVNTWVELSGELVDKEGNSGCGEFIVKARYRVVDPGEIIDDAVSVASKSTRPPPTPSKDDLMRASEKGTPRIGQWAEIEDADGNKYYYNASTGETSWDKPDENGQVAQNDVDVIRHGDWLQSQDENGHFYWYNEVTGESAWELPSDEPEEYQMHDVVSSSLTQGGLSHTSKDSKPYASASAGGYTIEL